MREYEVLLTQEAIHDAANLADHVETSFGKQRADRFQEELKAQLKKLETTGNMFMKTSLRYRGYAIHKKPFLPSIFFYIIKEEMREIHVLRILRQERDWQSILMTQRDYTYPT